MYFFEVESLASIKFSNTLELIKSYAFYGVENINSYELPESLLSMGEFAFGKNITLNEITIPKGVNFMGYYLFFGNSDLKIILNHESIPLTFSSGWNQGELEVILHTLP
jgi:hypothetical protein